MKAPKESSSAWHPLTVSHRRKPCDQFGPKTNHQEPCKLEDDQGNLNAIQKEAKQKYTEKDKAYGPVWPKGSPVKLRSINSSPPSPRRTRAKQLAPIKMPKIWHSYLMSRITPPSFDKVVRSQTRLEGGAFSMRNSACWGLMLQRTPRIMPYIIHTYRLFPHRPRAAHR
jgi:hypothetical protein